MFASIKASLNTCSSAVISHLNNNSGLTASNLSSSLTNTTFSHMSSNSSTSVNSLNVNLNSEIQIKHQSQQVLSPPLPAGLRKTGPGRPPRGGIVNSGNYF